MNLERIEAIRKRNSLNPSLSEFYIFKLQILVLQERIRETSKIKKMA